uniref:Transposase n=1 Tax=Bursaphelenchus xylophilus TaxID=6326 RepID=A0A1I7SGJ3_BURXY
DRRASESLIIALRRQAAACDLVRDSGEARHFAATIRRYFPVRLIHDF